MKKLCLRDVIDLDATFGSSSEVELNAETHQEKFEDSKPISDLNNKTLEESLPRNFSNFVDSNKTKLEDKDTETSEIENEDFDEDQTNVSLAAMENSLKPQVLKILKKLQMHILNFSSLQESRMLAALKEKNIF